MVRLKGNPTPLSAVVFDLGNVLVDYNPPRHMFKLGIPPEHIPRMMEILDKRPEWHEFDRGVLTRDDMIALAVRDEPSLRPEITRYIRHRSECFTALSGNVEIMYRVKEAGLKTYLLSNVMQDDYDYFSEHFVFMHDFDGSILSFQHQINKPDPAIFDLLLKTYPEIDPAHTLFIDDVERNCLAGAQAGLLTLCLPAEGEIAPYLEFTEE